MSKGSKEDPWQLETPSLTSEYEMYNYVKDGKEEIVYTSKNLTTF